jgi:hypothetical protein
VSDIRYNGLLYTESATDQLYGPSIGTETPADLQNFLAYLDSLLPNRGILDLKDINCLSHQSVLSALAARGLSHLRFRHEPETNATVGHLLLHVLEAFRSANIRSLSLTETLRNDAKTDLPATDTLIGLFSLPHPHI